MIYNSEQGFNALYANDGMWGRANYFAVNASYSHDYRHINQTDKTSQMFFARVILGKSKAMVPDRTLREPPFVEGIPQDRYDSV